MRPSECPEECSHITKCINFVGCGPKPKCDDPCWKCSFWENYGDSLKKILNGEPLYECDCDGDCGKDCKCL